MQPCAYGCEYETINNELESRRAENERLENALIAILNAKAPTPVLTYQLMERIAQAALRGEGE